MTVVATAAQQESISLSAAEEFFRAAALRAVTSEPAAPVSFE
jgi:hypothetical protein